MKNGKNKLDSLEGEIEDSIEDIKPKVVRSMNKATDCNTMLIFTNLQSATFRICKLQIYELANCNFTNLQIANLRTCLQVKSEIREMGLQLQRQNSDLQQALRQINDDVASVQQEVEYDHKLDYSYKVSNDPKEHKSLWE